MKNFIIIFFIVLIIQIPGWYLILGRDTGAINDFGNEGWIMIYELGETIFSFPIYYYIGDQIDSYTIKFIVYLIDLVLISLVLHLMIKRTPILRKNRNKKGLEYSGKNLGHKDRIGLEKRS